MISEEKESRLRLLAERAGDLMMEAYLGGIRDRAVFFNEKRKRILWPIWSKAQEVRNAKNKHSDGSSGSR